MARARAHGNEVHVWTANEPADIAFCRDLGVTGFTTDYPDRVLAALTSPARSGSQAESVPSLARPARGCAQSRADRAGHAARAAPAGARARSRRSR